MAASHHGNTPYSGLTSHIGTGYPIHHFRGRERLWNPGTRPASRATVIPGR